MVIVETREQAELIARAAIVVLDAFNGEPPAADWLGAKEGES